jgi:hypothetical protein
MTEKWELDGIDCDEIEANSSLTLDGGFDFNSIWNSDFRNQVGRSSLAKESTIPPENFKMFFKEQVTSFTEDNKFNGNLKITIGENKFDLKVPLNLLSSVKDVTCSLKNILKFSGGIVDSFARLLLPT